jgi:hypothetical protein
MIGVQPMPQHAADSHSLNTLDVTESVRVSEPESVKNEVLSIYRLNYPGVDTSRLENAFDLFAQLYQGRFPGYHPCDTLYHDIQHSLDIALTTARLLRGYHKIHGILTADQVLLGIITALFHDSGYIRKLDDNEHGNGAEYTGSHVSRGIDFMLEHLPAIDLPDIARRAAQIVHLTGYEVQPHAVEPEKPADRLIGDIVATADLITQIADRCYLEKCRDRLFPELTLAAEADSRVPSPIPVYRSAEDLLYSTPSFYRLHVRKRIEYHFKGVFRYAASYFNGPNYYILSIEKNIHYLEKLIDHRRFELLRRELPHNYGEKVFPYDRLDILLSPENLLRRAAR